MKLAKVISYLFHPVLFSTISTFLFFSIIPNYLPSTFKYRLLLIIFLSTYLIPILFLFILKKRKAIINFHLKSIEERKFPLLFFISITSLLGFRLLNLRVIDLLAYSFLAVSLALILVFTLFYLKIKTSIHTLAIGGLFGFVLVMSYHYKIQLLILEIIAILLFGIIASARLKLKAHTTLEVYLGFLIGVLTQLLTYTLYAVTLG